MSPLVQLLSRSLFVASAAATRARLRLLATRTRRAFSSSATATTTTASSVSTGAKLPTGNSLELGFYYRHPGKVSRDQTLIMEGFGAVVWFFFLYQTYNYPEMVFGHASYPNPRQWTDAELGIPPE